MTSCHFLSVAQPSNMFSFSASCQLTALAWKVTSVTTFGQIEGESIDSLYFFRLWVHLDLNIRGAWSESFAFSYRHLNEFRSFWNRSLNREGLHTSVSYPIHFLCLYFHNNTVYIFVIEFLISISRPLFADQVFKPQQLKLKL